MSGLIEDIKSPYNGGGCFTKISKIITFSYERSIQRTRVLDIEWSCRRNGLGIEEDVHNKKVVGRQKETKYSSTVYTQV